MLTDYVARLQAITRGLRTYEPHMLPPLAHTAEVLPSVPGWGLNGTWRVGNCISCTWAIDIEGVASITQLISTDPVDFLLQGHILAPCIGNNFNAPRARDPNMHPA